MVVQTGARHWLRESKSVNKRAADYGITEQRPRPHLAIYSILQRNHRAGSPFNMSSTTTTSTYTNTTNRRTLSRRQGTGLGGSLTASTPNLNQIYSSQNSHSSRLAPPSLSRKLSHQALTQSSLASIPDDSEDYSYNTITSDDMPVQLTPGRSTGSDISVGDKVDVPGNLHGTVRFIGSVAGRKGTYAGVELHPDFASRGKNSGDVDG